MNKTSIQWTNYTLQLVRFRSKATGRTLNWCQKISPGCRACYAERITRRFHGTQHSYTPAGRDLVEPYLDREALRELVTTRRRGMVFVEDMSDLFGDWVPDAWLDECFAAFSLSPLTIQVLTKRAARMRAYALSRTRDTIYPDMVVLQSDPRVTLISSVRTDWPLPNVWLGVSVEDRAHLDRLDHLRDTPAAIRFASFEPLLEDLGDLSRWLVGQCLDCLGTPCEECSGSGERRCLDWAIIGGERGPRPCDVAWIRSIRDQCGAVGTARFVKQLGSYPLIPAGRQQHWDWGGAIGRVARFEAIDPMHESTEKWRIRLKDSHGGDPAEWSADLRVRELPATIASSTEDAKPHRRQSRRSAPVEANGAATVPLHRGRPRRSRGGAA